MVWCGVVWCVEEFSGDACTTNLDRCCVVVEWIVLQISVGPRHWHRDDVGYGASLERVRAAIDNDIDLLGEIQRALVDQLVRQSRGAVQQHGDADAVVDLIDAQCAIDAWQTSGAACQPIIERSRRSIAVVLGFEDGEHNNVAAEEEKHNQHCNDGLDDLTRMSLLACPLLESWSRRLCHGA
jgi:hypothetical protein